MGGGEGGFPCEWCDVGVGIDRGNWGGRGNEGKAGASKLDGLCCDTRRGSFLCNRSVLRGFSVYHPSWTLRILVQLYQRDSPL